MRNNAACFERLLQRLALWLEEQLNFATLNWAFSSHVLAAKTPFYAVTTTGKWGWTSMPAHDPTAG